MAKFNKPVLDIENKPLLPNGGNKALLLGECCITALLASFEDERNLDGNEKLKRFHLANKIFSTQDDCALSAEETVLVKRLVAKLYGPLVVGRVFAELDPNS